MCFAVEVAFCVAARAVLVAILTVLAPEALEDAQASSNVPSTEKWSHESSRFTLGWANTACKNLAAISLPAADSGSS